MANIFIDDWRIVPDVEVPLVRVGRDFDGGYVIPEYSLSHSKGLLSGGYGNDFSFESDFLQKAGIKHAHIYDYSINLFVLTNELAKALIKSLLRRPHYSIKYHLKNIATYFLVTFSKAKLKKLKLVSNPVKSGEINLITSVKNLKTLTHGSVFCKLDIEGSEYELIHELNTLSESLTGIVIEFHQTERRREQFLKSLEILKANFVLVHVHPNNFGKQANDGWPVVFEMTFLPKSVLDGSQLSWYKSNSNTIHDQANDPSTEDIFINFS